MLSTEGFVYLQKVKVCYDYENLFIGQERSVRSVHQRVSVLGGLSLEKMYGVSPGTKKAVRKNEMSRIKRVSVRVDFHCHVIFKSVTFTVYIHSVRAFKTPSVKQLYGGGRKGLRYCGIGSFLVRCCGNFYQGVTNR